MTRILTAVLLIPTIVCLVLWASPYLLGAITLAIIEIGLWEFFRLAESCGAHACRFLGYVFAAVVVVSSLAADMPILTLAALVLLLMAVMGTAMKSSADLSGYLLAVSSSVFGIIYIAVPLSLLVWICLRTGGRQATLFALIVVWVGDSSAFFAGRKWGRHKLSPRISPGKTWEGSVASLLGAMLAGLVFAHYFWRATGFIEVVILAAVVNVAAQIGDLAESALKRGAGVKDSSQLVPGHGGVLDRIDALLFAAPVLWYYWLWKAL